MIVAFAVGMACDIIIFYYQVVMKELERMLKLYPGNTLSEYLSKNGVSSNDAQTGLKVIRAVVKDSEVRAV